MTTRTSSPTRWLAALGLLASATFSLLPLGCGSKIEYPSLHGPHPSVDPQVPRRTAEQLRDCLSDHGDELSGRAHNFHFTLQVDEEGEIQGRVVHDIPVPDGDLAACMKAALRSMEVPKWVLDVRPATVANSGKERALIGNAQVILIIIAMGELIIEAGGITVVLTIGLEMIATAAKDIADAARKKKEQFDECQRRLNECLLTDLNDAFGDNKGARRCEMCHQKCRDNGVWPFRISMGDDEYVTCAYWIPKWQR